MTDIPELTDVFFRRAMKRSQRERLMTGDLRKGDIAALRAFIGLSQVEFARALRISVHTLRNWEQGRRQPEGPAIALLQIAATHPKFIRDNLERLGGTTAKEAQLQSNV